MPQRELLILPEVSHISRAPLRSVRGWTASGALPSRRVGRRVLVRRADLAMFLGVPISEIVVAEVTDAGLGA